MKNQHEKRLKFSLWIRKWILYPCLCVSIAMMILSHLVASLNVVAIYWLFCSIYNFVNLLANYTLCHLYEIDLNEIKESSKK